MVKNSYHHGNLKEAIINEALKLLSTQNYSDLSFRLISRNIGVVSSAPYNHFRDKNHLLEELIAFGKKSLLKSIKKEKNKSLFPSEQLFLIAKAYLFFAENNKALFNLMFSQTNKELLYLTNEIVLQFENIVSEKFKTGKRMNLTVKGSAISAWSMIHGIAILLNHGDTKIIENVWEVKLEKIFKEMSAIWGKGVTN